MSDLGDSAEDDRSNERSQGRGSPRTSRAGSTPTVPGMQGGQESDDAPELPVGTGAAYGLQIGTPPPGSMEGDWWHSQASTITHVNDASVSSSSSTSSDTGGLQQSGSTSHQTRLIEGAERMAGEDGPRFGGLTDSAERSKNSHYNRLLWKRVRDDDGEDEDDEPYKLVLRKGGKASDALHDMFGHLGHWAFDCAEALQLLHWHAKLETLGDEGFDEWVKDNGGKLELREHDSTGIKSASFYSREDDNGHYLQNGPLTRMEGDGPPTSDLAPLLDRTSVGSRVMWRNFDPRVKATAPFKNENAIKLGPDRYFAHPLGVLTEEQLVHDLAMHGPGVTDETADEYAREYIQIAEIENFSAE